MNSIGTTAAILAACALGATAASAQTDTPPTTPPTEAPQTTTPPATTPTTPDANAPAATSASFTDGDVDQFATAVVAVQNIQQDAAVTPADKQTKMAAAVEQAGLTPAKFNSIAKTSQSDPALMKRIQTAAAAKMPAAPAGAAGSGDKPQ